MQWRLRKPARVERDDPPVFVLPCAPAVVERPPSGPDWLHEVKHDGCRMIARKDGDQVRLWTLQDPDCALAYRRIAAAIAKLPVISCMIDGEAVQVRPGGRSDFHALHSPGGGEAASLVCFDLIALGGDSIRTYAIEERRALLFSILEEDHDAPLVYNQIFNYDGAQVFEHICDLGLEGIVSKRRNTGYHSGLCEDWLVTPNPFYRRPWPLAPVGGSSGSQSPGVRSTHE